MQYNSAHVRLLPEAGLHGLVEKDCISRNTRNTGVGSQNTVKNAKDTVVSVHPPPVACKGDPLPCMFVLPDTRGAPCKASGTLSHELSRHEKCMHLLL